MTSRLCQPPFTTIRGFGLVTPLGRNAWGAFRALLDGRTLADRAAKLPADVDVVDRVRALGSAATAQHVADDPAVELAEAAAREAMTMAGPNASSDPLPMFVGTSKGAIATMWRAAQTHLEPGPTASRGDNAALAVALGPHGYLDQKLAQRIDVTPAGHFVAACASSLVALHQARQFLLRHDHATRALVVTSEAALLPALIHSYRRLGALAPVTADGYVQRPLDQRRHGFMLAEMGAALVLERTSHRQPGDLVVTGTAMADEAFDLIRPDPDMAALGRVARAVLGGQPVDLLHAHAPGTADHDVTELNVLREAVGGTLPDVYALKGAIGHGLGAAGLTSLVVACLCAKTKRRPPMPWLEQPIDQALRAEAQTGPMRSHAVFAAGFGGHVAGARMERVE